MAETAKATPSPTLPLSQQRCALLCRLSTELIGLALIY